jgi:hypothetical protein
MNATQLRERIVKKATEMTIWYKYEPSLVEILSDSATRALMRADGVEREELERMLEEIGRGLASNSLTGSERATECH